MTDGMLRGLARRAKRQVRRVARYAVKQVDARTVNLLNRVAALEREVPVQVETTAELAIVHGRVLARLEAQLAALADRTADQAAASLAGRPLAELGEGTARLLEWASGPEGPAAQAGLWLEPFAALGYGAGAVRLAVVSQRSVEVAYALAALAGLPSGRVVAVHGAARSPLPLLLASLGHHVTVVGADTYPVPHPRIVAVPATWPGPAEPCAAAVVLAPLDASTATRLDGRVPAPTLAERLRGWLWPDGRLVLSSWLAVDGPPLAALLPGWQVVETRYAYRPDGVSWELVDTVPSAGCILVLVQARPEKDFLGPQAASTFAAEADPLRKRV